MPKVLIDVRGGNVSVQELAEIGGTVALNPSSAFFSLGTVRESTRPGQRPGVTVKVWRWSSEGSQGEADTKSAAIDQMLSWAGYESVPLTATIPELF